MVSIVRNEALCYVAQVVLYLCHFIGVTHRNGSDLSIVEGLKNIPFVIAVWCIVPIQHGSFRSIYPQDDILF